MMWERLIAFCVMADSSVEWKKKELEALVLAWVEDKTTENMEAAVLSATGYVRGISTQIPNPVPHLLDRDDLIQCGLMGFLSALKKYDPAKGSFRTWSYPRIKGAMQDAVRAMHSTSRDRQTPMVSFELLEAVLGEQDSFLGLEDVVVPSAASVVLVRALRTLPLRQHSVIVFLLNGIKGRVLASLLDVSETTIRRERVAAVEHLTALLSDKTEETVSEILKCPRELDE